MESLQTSHYVCRRLTAANAETDSAKSVFLRLEFRLFPTPPAHQAQRALSPLNQVQILSTARLWQQIFRIRPWTVVRRQLLFRLPVLGSCDWRIACGPSQ